MVKIGLKAYLQFNITEYPTLRDQAFVVFFCVCVFVFYIESTSKSRHIYQKGNPV